MGRDGREGREGRGMRVRVVGEGMWEREWRMAWERKGTYKALPP